MTISGMKSRIVLILALTLGAFALGWSLRGMVGTDAFWPLVAVAVIAVLGGWLTHLWKSKRPTS
jgi:hypothetical protein